MSTKAFLLVLGLSTSSPAGLEFILLEKATSANGDYPYTITPDGNLLAGNSGGLAAVWNVQGQVTPKGLGTIFGVNADGTVFVGQNDDSRPAIWKNGMNAVPILATEEHGIAFTVTADGLHSAGTCEDEAVRFHHLSETKTAIAFPTNHASTVFKITPNGTTVVGEWGWQYLYWKAFIKIGQSDYEDLGLLFGQTGFSDSNSTYDISDDSKVAVGISRHQVFRWKEDTGMVGLGINYLNAGYRPVSISGDGRTIVGNSFYKDNGGTPSGGFVWNEHNGVRDLKTVIESGGIDLTGWFFETISAISFNGDVIAGQGILQIDGFDYQRGWMVRGFSQFLAPTISLNKEGNQYVIKFSGVLQESDDLGLSDMWQDVSGNPSAQYVIPTPLGERKFYRARSY